MGVVDNMSHASVIIEDIQRFILSLFLPTSMIRWVYLMLLHLTGGLGIYHFLATYIFAKKKDSTTSMPLRQAGNQQPTTHNQKLTTQIVACLAALFYQHNLGTIQQMYLPMEVFVVHFAYLPWLVWATLKALDTARQKYFIIFGILSLLSTPQAHVPTLFIVYAMAIGIVCACYVVFVKKNAWKSAVYIVLLSFITNAFWFLPFIYATITHSDIVTSSKAFQMASNDIFFRNHEYGNFKDIALIKGTLLEYYHYNFKANEYHFMFAPWLKHINSWAFLIPAWLSFFLALGGSIVTFWRYKKARIVVALFTFSIFMLGTDIPVIGKINELLREHVPLFKTVFRFVFTKFSILYVFGFSIVLAVGIRFIVDLIKHHIAKIGVLMFTTCLILVYILPSFRGHFYYDNLRVNIPQKYFDTFNFFNKQDPNTRIAMFPTPWYWSWLQPDWGTINSGFFWYAVPQPTTDLAFTPWSKHNENFYWELDRAVSLNNKALIEQVFTKYDITWIYLDKGILNAESKKITYDSLQQLLLKSSRIKKVQSFDDIDIYRFSGQISSDFVSIATGLPTISYDDSYIEYDHVFPEVGNYQKSQLSEIPDQTYPFYSLFSGKAPELNSIRVVENDESLILKGNTGILTNNSFVENTILSYAPQTYITENERVRLILPQAKLIQSNDSSSTLEVIIDKKSSLIYSSNKDKWFTNQNNDSCDRSPDGMATMLRFNESENTAFSLTSVNSSNCIKSKIDSVDLSYGYLLKVRYVADLQRGWLINIYNNTTKKVVLELYLKNNGKRNTDYIILPPQNKHDLGYDIYFNNKSEGVEKITNTLELVELYQIPYLEMKQITIQNRNISQSTILKPQAVNHTYPFLFYIYLKSNIKDSTLILHQGFDKGWKAYAMSCSTKHLVCSIQNWIPFFFGQELKDHVLVNNWANGWKLDSIANISNQQTDNQELKSIAIVFWPQYLQYLGFLILIFAVIFLLFNAKKRKSLKSV